MPFIYTLPNENIAGDVTPTLATGTADAENPLANLTDGDPTTSFFTTDSVGIAVVWDHASATRADAVSIPIHNIPAATACKFQMNATDSWGSPTVDADVTINAFTEFPDVVFVDLTGVTGYSASGFRYHRLFVPSHGGLTKIGDVGVWSTINTLTLNVRYGAQRTFERDVTAFVREDGSDFYYDHARIPRSIKAKFRVQSADYDLLQALWELAKGPINPFMIQQSVTHEAQYSRWVTAFPPRENITVQDLDAVFKEVGRGSPL